MSEIPITSRYQPPPASVFDIRNYIPEPETVAKSINYRQLTDIKPIRQQPQLDIVHLPNIEYPTLHSVQLPSETESSARSKLYPPLKPLRKSSTSLSKLLEITSQAPDYIPSRESQSSNLVPRHRNNLRTFPSNRLSTDSSTLHLLSLLNDSSLLLIRQHAQSLSTAPTTSHLSDFVP